MIYTITISGMEFRASHGCYDTEQKVGGNYTVDLSLDVEDDGGAATDDLKKTIDYVAVYEAVRTEMSVPSRIIENVAHRIAEAVKSSFPKVTHLTVTVSKLAPPLGGKASKVSASLSL